MKTVRIKTLSERVKFARQTAGLGSTELDDKAELAKGHTWAIENGSRPNIEARTASKLARVLGVSLDWLIDGTGEGPAARDDAQKAG